MADIMPFRGILYNKEKAGDLSKLMAPPYDVISETLQEKLYQRHPENIVRLILGKTYPGDTPENNRYTRARADFEEWRKNGVLARDKKPSVYYYIQDYILKDGAKKTRKGFIALSKLEEFGKGSIFPHEKTLSGPKIDRLNLMRACGANFCCVFSIYPESKKELARPVDILDSAKGEDPLIDVTGDDGARNRLWRIDEPGVIKKVAELMKSKKLFIADGHHRYETALNYRKEMIESLENPTGTEPFNYIMMYFAGMDDEGLEIFPTHRIVYGISGFSKGEFLGRCGQYFEISEFSFGITGEPSARDEFLKKMSADARTETRFGVFINGGNSYYLLTLKGRHVTDALFSGMPDVYKTLDVTVLHSLILKSILGIGEEAQEKQENLLYVKDINEALKEGRGEKNQIVFLMNPTKVADVKRVSEAGLLMPQKSTYFFPKLLSGLVINPLA